MNESGESEAVAAKIRFASDAGANAVADHIAHMLAADGERIIALPGGSTPVPIFAELAGCDLDWNRVTIYPTDDRCVPPDHEASNLGLLQSSFGDTGAHILPLEERLQPPRFDLVWLGMGADGHVASLFPNMDPRAEGEPAVQRDTPDPLPPEAPFDRLSFNMPALLDAGEIIFVLYGEEKKRVLDAAIAGEVDLPVGRLLRAARCPITIFWSAK